MGVSVFILGHRHPVVMAKMLTTIDVLSNGRLLCGVGVGWWKEELDILGAPFHARGRHADEILRLFKELWTGDNPSFAGEFFQLRDVGFAPKPVQKPHPPIWFGGESAGAFRRVVPLGDGWHAVGRSPRDMAASLGRLREAAEAAERPFETLALSARVTLNEALLDRGPSADGAVTEAQGYLFSRPVPAVRIRQLLNASHGRRRPDDHIAAVASG